MPNRLLAYNEDKTQQQSPAPNNPHSPSSAKMTTVPVSLGQVPAASRLHREPPICPTDDEALVPKKRAAPKQKVDKRSWEYIVKSGVAGGLAGCAVRFLSQLEVAIELTY
jgi:hypothetical protein